MSELKARTARSIADEEEMLELGADCPIESAQVYLKSEADKYIKELKEQNHELCQALHSMYSEEEMNSQKYKRCLDKAKMCESEENRLEAISPIFDTDKEYWEYNSDYWAKWHDCWLKLAEKFKEAK